MLLMFPWKSGWGEAGRQDGQRVPKIHNYKGNYFLDACLRY